MKVVAIIQARTDSTRLPGKVLLDLAGEPMLVRDMNRLSRSKTLDEIVIATTIKPADDMIVSLCQERGWPYFRGSEDDVLDRYYRAAQKYKADIVVRITSDCPLIDPEVVDRVVQEFLERLPEIDYVANTLLRRTFPRGLDTEVIRFDILEQVWKEDHNASWREHVTPYIWRQPERFKTYNVLNDKDFSYMRWTVDTPQDLAFARCIYGYFGHDQFTWREVLTLLEVHPEWLAINREVQQKMVSSFPG